MVAIAQQRQRADGDVHALEALEAADEQQQPAGSVADLASRIGAIDRLECREVDTGRDHLHAVGVRAVQLDQVVSLVLGRPDQQVGLLRDLALDANPQRRLRAGARWRACGS